jgi:hypothetical protein
MVLAARVTDADFSFRPDVVAAGNRHATQTAARALHIRQI